MTRSTHPQPTHRHRASRALGGVTIGLALLMGALPEAANAVPTAGLPTDPAAPQALSSASIKLTQVAGGLSQPVFVTGANDGTGRLFIVEKTGTIRILQGGTVLATPFLDISSSVSKGGEQGLLGLAFHPNFKTNRRLYVDYTNRDGNTVVREFRVSSSNPNRVTGTGRRILAIKQPYANHNGGMLAFGPDGYLYIGTGDGGSAGDPGNRAQSKKTLLGKILRININATTATHNYTSPRSNPYVGRPGRNEIWQRGVRNPWRFSFDRATGNLWIGDVGQARYEEIDRARNVSTGPGRGINWGWRVLEGFHCYRPATNCNRTGKTMPLLTYSHRSNGRCSVTGGYVYRGTAIPALRGWYVFGDFCSGEIWTVPAKSSPRPTRTVLKGPGGGNISSFGEDDAGNLYVVHLGGSVLRIDPA